MGCCTFGDGSTDKSNSDEQPTCRHADNICLHPNLYLVSRSSQALTTGSLPPRLPASVAPCSLHRRRHSHCVGCHLQLRLHIPMRPHLPTMDHSTSWTLYGSNLAAQVSDLDEHGHRSHDRGHSDSLCVAVADAKDGEVCCIGLFWTRSCLCDYQYRALRPHLHHR